MKYNFIQIKLPTFHHSNGTAFGERAEFEPHLHKK